MTVWILEVWDGENWIMEGVFRSNKKPLELVEENELSPDDYMIYEQELLD